MSDSQAGMGSDDEASFADDIEGMCWDPNMGEDSAGEVLIGLPPVVEHAASCPGDDHPAW